MLQKILIFTTLLSLLFGYFMFSKDEDNTKTIKIAPIVIEPSDSKSNTKELLSQDEILSKLEHAVKTSKKAASEEEIAQNVLETLEKSLSKSIITTPLVENSTLKKSIKEKTKKKQEKLVLAPKKPSKPKKLSEPKQLSKQKKVKQEIKVKKKETKKTEPQTVQKTPNIVLISKDSHASITQRNTLIENTHPESELTIFNGSKAYILDESADTQEISITQEEFEKLPWSKTYGVVEESENFEMNEEI